MRYNLVILLPFIFLYLTTQAQTPVPAPPQDQPIVITGATLHVGNGQVIKEGSIRFEDGIITETGTQVNQANAQVIEAAGQHIYPGLILPATVLGIKEIGALRQTRDNQETGQLNPNVRALIAYNTESEIIPTLRANGVLLAQTTPVGGLISGTSSVMELDGWTWEEAVHTADKGVHLRWIPLFQAVNWWSDVEKAPRNKNRKKPIDQLHAFFQEAQAYQKKSTPAATNLKLEAMKGLFTGEKILYVHASYAQEIIEAIQFAQKYKVKKIVLVGGEESLEVADFLKENNIPVILARVHRLPLLPEEDVWNPYKLPYLLQQKGVLVGLAYDAEDHEPMGARNLPFLAGTAAAYGLSKEDALKTVTSNTARILGVDDKVGTLEKGKQATLVISGGDLLDMRTNDVTHAFIRGKKIDLNNKQKMLYQRFKKKYEVQMQH